MTDNEIINITIPLSADKIKEILAQAEKCLAPFEVRDIVESQKAEIKEKGEIINAQADKIRLLEQALLDKQADIEKNENIIRLADKTIDKQSAEIERLRKECGNQSALWSKHYEDIFETAKETVKVEAIKEFAERLKDTYRHNTTSITSLVTLFDNINNLVKEMTEGAENNES